MKWWQQWRISLQKHCNLCIPKSYPCAARLWQEWSIKLCLAEHSLKNFHIHLNNHNLTLALLWCNGCSFSRLPSSFFLTPFFPFPYQNILLPNVCKVMRDLDSSSSLWSQKRTLFLCISWSFAWSPAHGGYSVPKWWINEWMMLYLSCDALYLIKPCVLCKTFSLTPSSQPHTWMSSQCVTSNPLRGRC